jgi:hypothetical protein
MTILVPEPLLDLGEPDLASEAQVFTILTRGKLGHRRNSLAAGVAGPNTVSLHTAMVARRGHCQRAGG